MLNLHLFQYLLHAKTEVFEYLSLAAAHFCVLLLAVYVIIAEKMEHRMYGQERYLALKAVAEFLCLLVGTLKRDNDVAKAALRLVRNGKVNALVLGKREGENVGGLVDVAELRVDRSDALVVGKGHRHLSVVFHTLIFKRFENRASYKHFKSIVDIQLILCVFKMQDEFAEKNTR